MEKNDKNDEMKSRNYKIEDETLLSNDENVDSTNNSKARCF